MIAVQVLTLATGWADDSDIFGANIQPNVMIIIDNSGSMADHGHLEPAAAE